MGEGEREGEEERGRRKVMKTEGGLAGDGERRNMSKRGTRENNSFGGTMIQIHYVHVRRCHNETHYVYLKYVHNKETFF